MGRRQIAIVRILCSVLAAVGWTGEALILTAVESEDSLGLLIVSATIAATGSIGVVLSLLPMTPRTLWQMAYDVGWTDGRRAERASAERPMPGVVTRLPVPTRR